jgi:hypothetical protein
MKRLLPIFCLLALSVVQKVAGTDAAVTNVTFAQSDSLPVRKKIQFDPPEFVYIGTNWWSQFGTIAMQRILERDNVGRDFVRSDVTLAKLREMRNPTWDAMYSVLGHQGDGIIPSNGYVLVQWRLYNGKTNDDFSAIDAWAGFYIPGPTNYPLFFLFRSGRFERTSTNSPRLPTP